MTIGRAGEAELPGSPADHRTPPKSGLGPIRQCYELVVGERRARWIALTFLALIASGFEAIGAMLVFALLGLVTDPGGEIEVPMVGDLNNWFPTDNTNALLIASGAVGLFFLIRGALLVLQAYAQHRVSYNAGAQLSGRLVRGYLAMPYAHHLNRDSSELVRNALTSVQESVNRVVLPATKFIAELLIIVGMTSVLFAIAPLASILALAVLAPATYLVLRVVKSRVRAYGRIATDSARLSLQILTQSLHGIRDLRLLGRETQFVRKFIRERTKDARARARQATLSALTSVQVETILVLFIVGFLAVTVTTVGTAADTFKVLGLFAYVGMRLKPSIQKIISSANSLRFATPAISDLHNDLLLTAKALQDQDGESSREQVPILARGIVVEDVSYRYHTSNVPALENVNLDILAGEAVGICGPTGGGKSTLVDIISGLLEPTSGRVLVDGVDVQRHVRSWHRQLGVVSQHVYLFDDTLRGNITLGIPHESVDDAAVQRAVRLAQLDDFVTTLPDGLETQLGEHGMRLSGGQRQRVAIARSLYRDPPVLILDEGTSALDNETERELIGSLEQLRGTRTIILVAHRLSSIQRCDRVVFVRNGRVSGVGTYDELLETNTSFREMAV